MEVARAQKGRLVTPSLCPTPALHREGLEQCFRHDRDSNSFCGSARNEMCPPVEIAKLGAMFRLLASTITNPSLFSTAIGCLFVTAVACSSSNDTPNATAGTAGT